jgi:Flp pilus assembly protein TadB
LHSPLQVPPSPAVTEGDEMAQQSESVTGLLRGALDDVRDLIREEVALARAELRHEASKVGAAGVQFGIAAVALWFAGMFLLIAGALGLAALFDWPAWAGFAVVSVLLAVAGFVAFVSGRRAVRTVQPLPRTVDSIKETFQ